MHGSCRSRVFYTFLLSYLLTLLLPLGIGVLAYISVNKTIERVERESAEAILERVKNMLDLKLDETEHAVTFMGQDSHVRRFATVKQTLQNRDYYELYTLIQHLKLYQSTNPFVHSFYLYFRNSNRIVTVDGSYELSSFYGYFTYGNQKEGDWQEIFLTPYYDKTYLPTVPVKIGNAGFEMLTHIQSFPGRYRENPTVVVWALIDILSIKGFLEDVAAGGWSYIMDQSGRLIASSGSSERFYTPANKSENQRTAFNGRNLDRQRTIVCNTTSSYYGWYYVAGLPQKSVMAKTRFVRTLLGGLGVVILFLGIATAYLMTLRSVKPLKELVEGIRRSVSVRGRSPTAVYRNEYDYIKKNVTELTAANVSLKKAIHEQLPMLEIAFFGRLLRGEYGTTEEAGAALSQIGLSIAGDRFLIALVRISPHGRFDVEMDEKVGALLKAKAALNEIVWRKQYATRLHIYIRATEEVVLLFSFTAAEIPTHRSITEGLLREIYRELNQHYAIDTTFSAGRICSDLNEVSLSFRDSLEASDAMKTSKGFSLSWYDNYSDNRQGYYYPSEIEERLLNNVKSGNREGMSRTIALVHRENLEARRVSADMLRFLLHDMCCSAVKALSQLDVKGDRRISLVQEIEELRYCIDFSQGYDALLNIYTDLCRIAELGSRSHKGEIIDKMKEFLSLHYSEWRLNRYQVASSFGITEEYFSTLFRERTGVCYYDYLINLRMKSADELLTETRLSIADIAEKVGYGNPKAFTRAFKRIKGINPSEYRNDKKTYNSRQILKRKVV